MTYYFQDNREKKLLQDFPEDLAALSGQTLTELKKEFGDLLVCSGETEDEIEKQTLFSISCAKGERILHTHNLMGFIGSPQGQMVITSRFCPESKVSQDGQKELNPERDFFLYYLLSKVMHFNWINLNFPLGNMNWMRLLPLLFPQYLNRACAQGLYKQYITTEHNDSKLKGRVDVARHLKYNVPFQGKFCYTQREYSFDNPLTQLVRHTIEYIRTTPWGRNVLSNSPQTRQNVQSILQATPSYAPGWRGEVIRQNLRPLRTAYFSQYVPLQLLCLRILRGEHISYGQSKKKIYGIIFDGAWLWEAYLNTLLAPEGFSHPDNKKKIGKKYLFVNDKEHWRFPDFYKSTEIVLDAKYKDLEKKGTAGMREDLHQLITYMHILPAPRGVLVYPKPQLRQDTETTKDRLHNTLNGLGGQIARIHLTVPPAGENYSSFIKHMKDNEGNFKQAVNEFLSQAVSFK